MRRGLRPGKNHHRNLRPESYLHWQLPTATIPPMRRNEVDPDIEKAARAALQPRFSFGFSRRRLTLVFAGLVCLWLVGVFARQVGEAAAAADQAQVARARNAAALRQIDNLKAELTLIQQSGFIDSTARGYLLGSPREIPFTIDPNAPALTPDAPGSVGIKATPTAPPDSPFDSWLKALFGG